MLINLIILIIISFISYKICDKSFHEKEELKNSSKITIIIFRISFILCNLITAFIILYILFPINNYDIYFWKFFLTLFSSYFFYFLPFYLIYNLYAHTTSKKIYKILGTFFGYLIISNITYRFFNNSYEQSIFSIYFYFSYSNILEYLAFIGDIFNGINGAYTAVDNISSLLVYPILKKGKLINRTDTSIKKDLEDINNKISTEENKLNELNEKDNELLKDYENNKTIKAYDDSFFKTKNSLLESKQKIKKSLHRLKSIQISYEYQFDVTSKKENINKEKGFISSIIKIIKIAQGFIFLISAIIRVITQDYSYYNYPLDLNEKSSIYGLLKTPYLPFSDGFITFVEQVYSLAIIFVLFSSNFSVSKSRIMECIFYVFSYMKKDKSSYYDIQMLIFSFLIFSYYLICNLLIVNCMKYIYFREKLHVYLFPGFDFENLHWYYDCPYVLAASFFIIKEIVEYTNIVTPKKD